MYNINMGKQEITTNAELSGDVREKTFLRVLSLLDEYNESNWDGYGASSVSFNSIILASRFIEFLPSEIEEPDIDVDADGFVVFEWYHSKERQCQVYFSDDLNGIFLNLVSGDSHEGFEGSERDIKKIIQKVKTVAFPNPALWKVR